MGRRIAVLDLGTNTFHLLIADVGEGGITRGVLKDYLPVKLGEGGITKGYITPQAFERGINAILKLQETITFYHATEVKAVATAAIRSASNGGEFINAIKKETGITVEVIDGNREAELIYKGVKAAVSLANEVTLITDIGGGSVEFILCNRQQIIWKKSYPLGAARLMESFHRSDPISKQEIAALETYLDETLVKLMDQCKVHKPGLMIGSAGAFETFALLVTKEFGLPDPAVTRTWFEFNIEQFNTIAASIIQSTHPEREANQAIIPLRVDMIVVAAVLTRYLIGKLSINHLMLSAFALREGVLADLLE